MLCSALALIVSLATSAGAAPVASHDVRVARRRRPRLAVRHAHRPRLGHRHALVHGHRRDRSQCRPPTSRWRCYRRVSDGWALERSVPASVTSSADGRAVLGEGELRRRRHVGDPSRVDGRPGEDRPFSATSTEIRVSSRPDAIVWNRDGVLTLPERMAYRLDARQMIVATATSLASHSGSVALYEYRSGDWVKLVSSPCALRAQRPVRGQRPAPRQRQDAHRHLGDARLRVRPARHQAERNQTQYRHITKYHWWSAEKGSTLQHVGLEPPPRGRRAPHRLHANVRVRAFERVQRQARTRSVYGRGTGIFLHVWLGRTTAGCVSVPRETMQQVFKLLDPAKRRVFVVGTRGETDPTRTVVY